MKPEPCEARHCPIRQQCARWADADMQRTAPADYSLVASFKAPNARESCRMFVAMPLKVV